MADKIGFQYHVTVVDGDAAYDTEAEVYGARSTTVGQWARIWEMTIKAQTAVRWGFGVPGIVSNQGYMWFAMLDITTAFESGNLRLGAENAARTRKEIYCQIADVNLHTQTNTTLATAIPSGRDLIVNPLPEQGSLVLQDSRIFIEYCLTAADQAGVDHVGFAIPITKYQ